MYHLKSHDGKHFCIINELYQWMNELAHKSHATSILERIYRAIDKSQAWLLYGLSAYLQKHKMFRRHDKKNLYFYFKPMSFKGPGNRVDTSPSLCIGGKVK